MNANVEKITSVIKDIVTTDRQVQGGRLSALLKARVPEWNPADFGVRSLREFVASYVPGVIEAGRSGMDVMYALEAGGPVAAPSVPGVVTQADFWRVWVSPNSPHALALDRAGQALRVVPRGGPAESGQVLLEPPAVELHREIAQAFLPSLPVDLQSKLQDVLNSTSKHWWQAWVRELRGSEHLAAWNAFRRQKLEEHLAVQLRSAGLAQPAIVGILKVVRERHELAAPKAPHTPGGMFHQQDDVATLRRTVVEAVQRMSVAELRELRLPIGIVLDVLATSKSR